VLKQVQSTSAPHARPRDREAVPHPYFGIALRQGGSEHSTDRQRTGVAWPCVPLTTRIMPAGEIRTI
jgi:hypothetical protein